MLLRKCGQVATRVAQLIIDKAGLWEEKIVQRKRHKILKAEANPAVTAIAHARPIPLPAPVTMPILSFSRSDMKNSLAEHCRTLSRSRLWARNTLRLVLAAVLALAATV